MGLKTQQAHQRLVLSHVLVFILATPRLLCRVSITLVSCILIPAVDVLTGVFLKVKFRFHLDSRLLK